MPPVREWKRFAPSVVTAPRNQVGDRLVMYLTEIDRCPAILEELLTSQKIAVIWPRGNAFNDNADGRFV
jgi:hypothetical protein